MLAASTDAGATWTWNGVVVGQNNGAGKVLPSTRVAVRTDAGDTLTFAGLSVAQALAIPHGFGTSGGQSYLFFDGR